MSPIFKSKLLVTFFFHFFFRFCPSVFLCVAGVVPGIWLLQMELYRDREQFRIKNNQKECGDPVQYNVSQLSSGKGVRLMRMRQINVNARVNANMNANANKNPCRN